MTFAFSKTAGLKTRRRFYVTIVVAITFLFLLSINLGSYFFIKRMGKFLEQELDKRLRASAMLVSGRIERALNQPFMIEFKKPLGTILSEVKQSNDLEGAFIIDDSYHVLADARALWDFEPSREYLRKDSTSIAMAFNDNVVVSPLHVIEGSYFKSVYAPIYAPIQENYDEMAVLVLEASAQSVVPQA